MFKNNYLIVRFHFIDRNGLFANKLLFSGVAFHIIVHCKRGVHIQVGFSDAITSTDHG
jgi:hypothetical protein